MSWCDDLGLMGHEHDIDTMQSVLSTLRLRRTMFEALGQEDTEGLSTSLMRLLNRMRWLNR